MIYFCACGNKFGQELGKHGCPNCCGDHVAVLQDDGPVKCQGRLIGGDYTCVIRSTCKRYQLAKSDPEDSVMLLNPNLEHKCIHYIEGERNDRKKRN
jgi:hypothetical protein